MDYSLARSSDTGGRSRPARSPARAQLREIVLDVRRCEGARARDGVRGTIEPRRRMDAGVLQLLSTLVGGAIGGGVAWMSNHLARSTRREDRAEERRRADYERALDAYTAMLREVADYRAVMMTLKPEQNVDAQAARHREVQALASLVADPEIELIFERCLKFITEAASKPPHERSDDLAAADLAYRTLVYKAKFDLEWRLHEGSGDVVNAAKSRFMGTLPQPLDERPRAKR